MFRKTSGAILCPSCGRLTNADAAVCLVCGRRNPGMWGFAGPLRKILGPRNYTQTITIACVVLYIVSLVFDPAAALRPRGAFDIFSPSGAALRVLGETGGFAWQRGEWWTLLTAIYLHGSLLHILFNVLWIRQLGPAVENLYGSARFFVIFTIAGAAGFVLSNVLIGYPTVGASGSIFGLLGAMVAFGRKRGGAFGAMVLRQYGQWALVLFLMGFFMGGGINNVAHAGGFIGGFLAGLAMSLAEHRAETLWDRVLASVCGVVTVAGFGLAIWTAFGA
jgi:membrane associated rhomboid family serine protease